MEKTLQPRGSIIFKILILILLALMLTSILYPASEWKAQNRQRDICRLRMENLSYAIREYGLKNRGYTDELREYLRFIKEDSVLFEAPRYEIESLVRDEGAGRDSLLLDFTDDFHLNHFTVDTIRPDSVHVRAVPHPQFDKIPVATLVLTAQSPISVVPRARNVADHAVLIYAASQIKYDWIFPDPILMKAADAIISIPVDSLGIEPTTRLPYRLHVNVRARLEGSVNFLVHESPVDTNITRDSLMVDLFNHRLKTEALAEVLVIVKQDTSLIEKKDSILVDRFHNRVLEIKPGQSFDVTGDFTITVPADSMANWDDSLRIRRSVFVTHVDSLSEALKAIPDFEELALKVTYVESYRIAKIDTTGVTVQCPIDSLYREPDRSLFEKIFGVGPAKNHGQVVNGDLSWSEKK